MPRDSDAQEIIATIKRHEPVTELSVPVLIDTNTVGTVTIGLSEFSIEQQIAKAVLSVVAFNLLVAIIFGIVLFLVSKRIILTPLSALADASARLAKGDLSTQVEVVSTGEVRVLVESFNRMAADLNRTTVSRDYVDNIIRSMSETLVVISPDKRIISANSSLCALLGYKEEDLIGNSLKVIFGSDKGPCAVIEDLSSKGCVRSVETSYRTRTGESVPVHFSASTFSLGDRVQGIVCVATDITVRKQAAQKIEHLARHDHLTKLLNRFSLMERLSQALELAKRASCHLAIMFIDLDRFKNINDSLGHHVGDLLLFQVAARLLKSVRSADIVARLGGDEFVVVLTQLPSGLAAARVVSKIHLALTQSYQLDGHDLQISTSIGISVFPHDGDTAEELIKNADFAMFHAKSKGRDNYQFFKQEMNSTARERLLLESGLRTAIKREELLLHYQPQIDLLSGRVIGVEALLRWQHPERGLVQPEMFIPIAEESGLILPIGDLALSAACRQLTAWLSEGLPPIRMAVNLSARQFRQENLPSLVAEIIAETGIDPHLLELEISESTTMDNPETVTLHLRKLREMGVELAIDDFGTGCSSLSYLKLFPVNRLKIDRSFVKCLETDSDDAAIAAATIALAHKLGKEVVAEGVETYGQLSFLREQKCDIVQGYYFSRPLPAAELAEFLRRNHREKGPLVHANVQRQGQ